jgi:hypothetical protein
MLLLLLRDATRRPVVIGGPHELAETGKFTEKA